MALNNPYALSFDKIDDYVATSFFNTSRNLTVSFKAKGWYQEFGIHRYILSKGWPRWPFWMILIQGAKMYFRTYSSFSTVAHLTPPYTIAYDEWRDYTYVVKSVSGGYVKLYDNGVEVLHQNTTRAMHLGSTRLTINPELHNYRTGGLIDEVRIWHRLLTPAEIQEYMNKSLTGQEEGLAAYYRMDSGSGDVMVDSSPNGHHGTIYGATWIPGAVDLTPIGPVVPITTSVNFAGKATVSVDTEVIRGTLPINIASKATVSIDTEVARGILPITITGKGSMEATPHIIANAKADIVGRGLMEVDALRLIIPSGAYVITADDYIRKNQPSKSGSIANYIIVETQPLKPVPTAVEVFKTSELQTIEAGETVTISAKYNKKPVIEAIASLADNNVDTVITDV